MKVTKIALALLALNITACSSDDDNETTPISPESRTVSIGYSLDIKEPSVSIEGNEYIHSTNQGDYVHRLKVNGYTMCVNDTTGEHCQSELDIDDNNISFDVVGAASVSVFHPVEGQLESSYTVTGSADIAYDQTQVSIELANTEWAAISIDDSKDIETKASRTENDSARMHQADGYGIQYTYANAQTGVVFNWGETAGTNVKFEANKHYAFEVVANREIELGFSLLPVFGEPIEICIGFCPDPIVNLENINGATNIKVNDNGSISMSTQGYSVWINEPIEEMPISDITDFTFAAENFNSDYYVNVYLLVGDENEQQEKITVTLTKEDKWSSVIAQYPTATLRNYTDLGDRNHSIMKGNFFLRLGDSKYASSESFILTDFSVVYKNEQQPTPTLPIDNIIGAKEIVVNSDGSVSGNIGVTGSASAYSPVESNTQVQDYTNVDIEAVNSKAWWNLYIESTEDENGDENLDQFRINWEPSLQAFSVYYRDFANETNFSGAKWQDAGDYSLATWSDVLTSKYATMIVQNWQEGSAEGNFFLRLGKSSESDTYDFTISKFIITKK